MVGVGFKSRDERTLQFPLEGSGGDTKVFLIPLIDAEDAGK